MKEVFIYKSLDGEYWFNNGAINPEWIKQVDKHAIILLEDSQKLFTYTKEQIDELIKSYLD